MARDKSALHLLAQNLKRLRQVVGLSQAKLAERCDLSTNFVSELEGEKVWVSAETLDRLAAALGVQPHALFVPITASPNDVEKSLVKILAIFEQHTEKTLGELRAEIARALTSITK